ncbi:MAG TPA: hypothetical protein VF476_13335 [Chitinophagaceae bacterium]
MKSLLLAALLLITIDKASAQGQFAGAKTKPLIGKKFNNDRVLPGLPDYEYREATIASGDNDPEQFSVAVFQKGPTYVVIFTVNEDTTTDDYTVLDVLVIKQVKKTEAVKVLLCRRNKTSNIEIVAVTQPGKAEYSPASRAWRFNRDKRRFESASASGVDCMNEGDD